MRAWLENRWYRSLDHRENPKKYEYKKVRLHANISLKCVLLERDGLTRKSFYVGTLDHSEVFEWDVSLRSFSFLFITRRTFKICFK